MMKIKVRLYGTLGSHIPDFDALKELSLEVPEGSTISDLIDRLAVPRKKVGIVSVDGRLAKATEPLHSGDFVRIYRPLAGG
jgi:molybdopterin synthase sulfur carrier subunit